MYRRDVIRILMLSALISFSLYFTMVLFGVEKFDIGAIVAILLGLVVCMPIGYFVVKKLEE